MTSTDSVLPVEEHLVNDGPPGRLSDEHGDDDASSVAYSWNSDDGPPEEAAGEQFLCSADKLVRREVLRSGSGQERPGNCDRALLDYRRDVAW